jgi:thiol-disulfide isomerase/thioredoxin/CRISPR/Cas system-associated protein endoribonuclease Cas2
MKKSYYYIFLFLILTIFACGDKKEFTGTCVISGEIENYKTGQLRLFEITLSKKYFVSKIEIGEDGSFEHKFNAKEKSLYGIQFRNFFIYFINDVSEIKIKTSANEFMNYFIEGSDESEALRQLIITERRFATEKVIANKLLYNTLVKTNSKMGNSPELLILENKSDKSAMEHRGYITEYIDSVNNKLLAVAACSFLNMSEDYNFLRLFSNKIKNTSVKKKQINDLKLELDKIQDGFKYIAPLKKVKGFNTEEKEINVANFNGKYVFVNIWATWCYSSKVQMPFVMETYNKYKENEKIEFVNVAIDEDLKQWQTFLRQNSFVMKNNLCDPFGNQAAILKRFGIDYIPANFLLDTNGSIISANLMDRDISYVIDSVLKK